MLQQHQRNGQRRKSINAGLTQGAGLLELERAANKADKSQKLEEKGRAEVLQDKSPHFQAASQQLPVAVFDTADHQKELIVKVKTPEKKATQPQDFTPKVALHTGLHTGAVWATAHDEIVQELRKCRVWAWLGKSLDVETRSITGMLSALQSHSMGIRGLGGIDGDGENKIQESGNRKRKFKKDVQMEEVGLPSNLSDEEGKDNKDAAEESGKTAASHGSADYWDESHEAAAIKMQAMARQRAAKLEFSRRSRKRRLLD